MLSLGRALSCGDRKTSLSVTLKLEVGQASRNDIEDNKKGKKKEKAFSETLV